MSKNIYDELFLSAEDIRQTTAEARDAQRLSDLQWLSNHIKCIAKDGKFSTTIVVKSCMFVTDEDWEQLRNRGYHIIFNYVDATITISWEKDYGI